MSETIDFRTLVGPLLLNLLLLLEIKFRLWFTLTFLRNEGFGNIILCWTSGLLTFHIIMRFACLRLVTQVPTGVEQRERQYGLLNLLFCVQTYFSPALRSNYYAQSTADCFLSQSNSNYCADKQPLSSKRSLLGSLSNIAAEKKMIESTFFFTFAIFAKFYMNTQ